MILQNPVGQPFKIPNVNTTTYDGSTALILASGTDQWISELVKTKNNLISEHLSLVKAEIISVKQSKLFSYLGDEAG